MRKLICFGFLISCCLQAVARPVAPALKAPSSLPHVETEEGYTAEFDSLFLEGLYNRQRDSLEQALHFYEACQKINPNSAAVAYELSLLYEKQQDSLQSISHLQDAVKLHPENYFYLERLAQSYSERKELDKAAEVYALILKKFPEKDYNFYALSLCYTQLGDYKKSIATLNQLERRIGITKVVSMEKARLYLFLDKRKAALRELDKVINKFPLDAELFVYKGDVLLNLWQMEEAEKAYQQSLALEPENGMALMSLCGFYDRAQRKAELEECLYRVFASTDIDYQDKIHYFQLSEAYYRKKFSLQPEEYSKVFNRIFDSMVAVDPDNAHLRYFHALFLKDDKQAERMVSELRTATYLNPLCEDCWLEIFTYYYEKQDSVQASKLITEAREAMPASATFNYFSAIMEEGQGHREQALQFLKTAEDLVGKDSTQWALEIQIYLASSNIYFLEDSLTLATDYVRRAWEMSPNDGLLQNNYAYFLALEGKNLELAEKLSAKTIEKDPLNAVYLDTYAFILYKQKKLTLARFYMEKALEYLQEENGEYYDHYGDILFELGEKEAAIENWQKALRLEPSEAILQKLLQNVHP